MKPLNIAQRSAAVSRFTIKLTKLQANQAQYLGIVTLTDAQHADAAEFAKGKK